MLTSSANGSTRCFAGSDGNGNVVTLVDAENLTLRSRYEYTPFGEALRVTGAAARNNPLRFCTKFSDDETGLIYYGYRYYNPRLGRWASPDPMAHPGFRPAWFGQSDRSASRHPKSRRVPRHAFAGLYRYVSNEPVAGIDVLGLLQPSPSPSTSALAEFVESATHVGQAVISLSAATVGFFFGSTISCGPDEDEILRKNREEAYFLQDLKWQQDMDDCMDEVAEEMEKKMPGGNWDFDDFWDQVEDCMIDKGWPPHWRE